MNKENNVKMMATPHLPPCDPKDDSFLIIDLEKKIENNELITPNPNILGMDSENHSKQMKFLFPSSAQSQFTSRTHYEDRMLVPEQKSQKKVSFLKNQLHDISFREGPQEIDRSGLESASTTRPLLNNGSMLLARRFINNLKKAAYLRSLPANGGFLKNDISYFPQNTTGNKGNLIFFWRYFKNMLCWEEKFRIELQKSLKIYTIHPFRKFKICWDLFLFLNTLFLFFYVPFTIGFEWGSTEIGDNIEISELVILLLDIFLTLNTSYVENGILIRDRFKICSLYIKENLILDLLAIFSLLGKNDHFASEMDQRDNSFIILKMMIYVRMKMFQARYNKIKEYMALSSRHKGSNIS